MEWIGGITYCGLITLEVVCKNGTWEYDVSIGEISYGYGTTDTEERAKRFAIYEAHRIIRDLVNDLAEITGENYHLELN